MDMKKDPAFLNAELIDQIYWFQSQKSISQRNDTISMMADLRRHAYTPDGVRWAMLFWICVERWSMDGVLYD